MAVEQNYRAILFARVVEILIRRGQVSVINADSLWHNLANHEHTLQGLRTHFLK
jgi:hypothetical protein